MLLPVHSIVSRLDTLQSLQNLHVLSVDLVQLTLPLVEVQSALERCCSHTLWRRTQLRWVSLLLEGIGDLGDGYVDSWLRVAEGIWWLSRCPFKHLLSLWKHFYIITNLPWWCPASCPEACCSRLRSPFLYRIKPTYNIPFSLRPGWLEMWSVREWYMLLLSRWMPLQGACLLKWISSEWNQSGRFHLTFLSIRMWDFVVYWGFQGDNMFYHVPVVDFLPFHDESQ